jgi:hypothetical protein
VLRLACQCGRNLADVRLTGLRAGSEPEPGWIVWQEHLLVAPRPGVRQREHRRRVTTLARRWPDEQQITYAWDCRCGRRWECREERIAVAWRAADDTRGIIRLTLGSDV